MTGNLIIVSAPSGAGKTTLVGEVLKRLPKVKPSVSYTSRQPRADEVDGVHYHFVTREAFAAMIARDEFLEWAEVYGKFYGTARANVERLLAAGDDVILTIDVQGAAQVRRLFAEARSVILLPPSYQILLQRLGERGANGEQDLRVRMLTAIDELAQYPNFDYVVINDQIEQAIAELTAIVVAERCRRAHRTAEIEGIIQTFQNQ